MKLFDGTAYFSPSVPSATKDAWATHGGTVTKTLKQNQLSQWYFCSGASDPCVARFQACPVIVFHSDWILAAVASQFSLPLTEYVLDERYSNAIEKLAPAKEVQGSYLIGNLHEASEINTQINKAAETTVSTRLSTTAEPGRPSKRPYDSSPEHRRVGQGSRLGKKIKLQSEQSFSCLQTQTLQMTPSLESTPTAVRIKTEISSHSAPTNVSLSSPIFTSRLTNAYSARSPFYASRGATKERFYYGQSKSDSYKVEASGPKSITSGMTKSSRGRQHQSDKRADIWKTRTNNAESWETFASNSISRSALGSDSGTDSTHPESLAFTESNMWLSLIHSAAHFSSEVGDTGADTNSDQIPTIRVSDAIGALKRVSANILPNCDVVLFRAGDVYRGRKFSVDMGGDRRKTI